MARCPIERLSDVTSALEKLRRLPRIKETKPGIFYIGAQGFLHFHLQGDRRWADVRDGKHWGKELDLPFEPTKMQKEKFLHEVFRRHRTLVG